jgi:hypothetical protein
MWVAEKLDWKGLNYSNSLFLFLNCSFDVHHKLVSQSMKIYWYGTVCQIAMVLSVASPN